MKQKGWLITVALLLAGIVLVVILSRPEHSSGSGNTGSNNRIISLLPSLTQSIYYLDAQDKLVGCTNYCQAAKGDQKEIVASVLKPNIEKIVTLKPDIVLASRLIPEKDLATIRKFGIQVEVFDSPTSYAEICDQFIRLGKLIDKESKAIEIIEESKAKIATLQRKLPKQECAPKVFMQIGASPIYTVIPNTFMNDYITYCGGTNIAEKLTSGTVGREFVVSQNPDYIFVVTMGIVGEDEAKIWQQFPQISAVVNRNIYILNSDVACQPTPVTFVETLEKINQYMTRK